MREVLLKIFLDNDIHKRLDLSAEFFRKAKVLGNRLDCTNSKT